jgi:hypothetical protein
MFWRAVLVSIAVLIALSPARAFAQDPDIDEDDGLLLRINGDVRVAEGETESNVVVIRGDLVVDGRVRDQIWVINGDAVIGDTGVVDGDINIIRGDLSLAGGSRVNDVTLYDSDIDREQGATVDGDISRENGIQWGFAATAFWIYVWLSMTAAVVLAGLIFAAVGGSQLTRASYALTSDAAMSILAAVVIWIGAPLLAVLAFVTLVGIPFAIGVLLVALPALWFLGYIVSGVRIGLAITRRGAEDPDATDVHPYLAALVGLLILQIIALIPVLGWIIVILAGVYGAGGLALIAARGFRGGGTRPAEQEPAPSAGT